MEKKPRRWKYKYSCFSTSFFNIQFVQVVPGLKIIGLSSEMRRAMAGQPPEDEEGEEEEEDDDEDEDGEEDDESEEEEAEGDEDAEDGEENEEAEDDEEEEEQEEPAAEEEQKTPEMKLLQKTPKVTIRKVMKVIPATPTNPTTMIKTTLKVATPGGGTNLPPATKKTLMGEMVTESGKKRGRPSKAEVTLSLLCGLSEKIADYFKYLN